MVNKNLFTLIFINKNLYEFRDSVKKLVDILYLNQLICYCRNDLVQYLATKGYINSCYSKELQKVREEYYYQYVQTSNSLLEKFKLVLEDDARK
jgi:hypothetical protein